MSAASGSIERRYQVFISSTYLDLVEERREVMQAVLEMECLPAGMELFAAGNDDQWTLIQEVIDQSDYYIVIVGGRYGSTTAEGISYTEKEYDYAVSKGIPVMGFLHNDPDQIIAGKTELEPAARELLDAFREKVRSRIIKTYDSPKDLGSVVSRALNRMMRTNPREGWIRGNLAMTPETRAEIAELRAALSDLQKSRVEEAAMSAAKLDLTYEHGDDLVEVQVTYTGRDRMQDPQRYTGGIDYSWDDIIRVIGPVMIDEAPERTVREALQSHIGQEIVRGLHKTTGWEPLSRSSATVTDGSWGNIIVQLRALGVMQVGVKKRTVADRSIYWTLTPGGDQYLVGLLATKRGQSDD